MFYTPEKVVYHTHEKIVIEQSQSSTQIAYRQQDNCTNTLIIYSTIPMSALKHTYQLRGMAITLHRRATISPGQRQLWTAISLLLAWHSRGVYERTNPRFFCFEARVRSEVQCHVTRLTRRTPTQDHWTVQHQTIRYNLTYLRMGAQMLPG